MRGIRRRKPRSRSRLRKKAERAVLFLIALLFATSFLMPIVLTIANSFMEESEINSNYGVIFDSYTQDSSYGYYGQPQSTTSSYVSESANLKFIPDMVTFKQYYTVLLQSPDYLLKFWNSVILVVPIVVFQILIALGAAYSFTRFRGRKKELLFFLYVILMLMPYQVSLVPNFLVSKWLGIYNTRAAVILPGVFSTFSVYLLTKFMRRIPTGLIEAAKLDGANEWQIFTRVCIPLCKSAIASTAILVFIDYWNMVEQPLILMSDTDKYPLSIFLSEINKGEVGLAFAVAVIYMIPTILIYLYGEEYLVDGISYSGGVKG
jgi:multiple sugar transport system permease protein